MLDDIDPLYNDLEWLYIQEYEQAKCDHNYKTWLAHEKAKREKEYNYFMRSVRRTLNEK